jgi:excisionase family DNA binding protein
MLLTTREAAERIGVNPSRIRQLVRDKKITGIMDRRDLLVSVVEVDAYAAARRKYVKKGKLYT